MDLRSSDTQNNVMPHQISLSYVCIVTVHASNRFIILCVAVALVFGAAFAPSAAAAAAAAAAADGATAAVSAAAAAAGAAAPIIS